MDHRAVKEVASLRWRDHDPSLSATSLGTFAPPLQLRPLRRHATFSIVIAIADCNGKPFQGQFERIAECWLEELWRAEKQRFRLMGNQHTTWVEPTMREPAVRKP